MPGIKDSQTTDSLLLSPEEARLCLGEGQKWTVLDARGRAAHARSDERVAGDLRASGKDLSELIAQIRQDDWLLAYCTCLGDGLAIRVAARLREAGFPRAFGIAGGLEGCRQAGLEISRKVPEK